MANFNPQQDAQDTFVIYKREDIKLYEAIRLACGYSWSTILSNRGMRLAGEIAKRSSATSIPSLEANSTKDEILDILINIIEED